MLYAIFVLVNMITMCLLLGGMAEVALVEIPLFRQLSPERFIEVHSTLDQHIDRYMPLVTMLAVLSALGELIVGQHSMLAMSIVIGIVCLVAVALISHLINVPLNRRIRTWKASAPTTLSDIKQQWIRSHYLRTLVASMSFLAFTIPIVLRIA